MAGWGAPLSTGEHSLTTTRQPITIHGIVDGSGRRPLIKYGVNATGEFSSVEFRMANANFTTSGWYQLTKAFTVTHPVSSVDLNVRNNSGASETWLVDDASLTAQ